MPLFYSSVPVSHDSVAVSQHEQYQDRETEFSHYFILSLTSVLFLLKHVKLSSLEKAN